MEKTKSVLDHMKSRLGMYVPVQDGKPTGEVWGCLLREIIQGGIASFRRGEATRIEICTDDASGSFTVSYDGISYSPENLFAMCNGTQTMFTGGMGERGFGWYQGMAFPILNVLSEKFSVEISNQGVWRTLVCGRGQPGYVEDIKSLFPLPNRQTIVCFVPNEEYSGGDHDLRHLYNNNLGAMCEAIACANPGLTVVENEQVIIRERGMDEVVHAWAAKVGDAPLISFRQVRFCSARVCLAVIPRTVPGRLVSVRALLDGWEVGRGDFLKMFLDGLSGWLVSCPHLKERNYECRCVIEGAFRGNELEHQQYKYTFAGDSAKVTIEPDGPLGKSLGADVNRCWMELFKEYVA